MVITSLIATNRWTNNNKLARKWETMKNNIKKVINARNLAIAGWFIIYTAVIVGISAIITLNVKTSFDNDIKATVTEQVQFLTSK